MKQLGRRVRGPIARGTVRTTFVLGLRLVVRAGNLIIENRGKWPNTMRIGRPTVSLPLSPKLTDADVERVISAASSLISSCR